MFNMMITLRTRNRKAILLPTGLGMVREIDPSTHPGMERWSFNVSGGGGVLLNVDGIPHVDYYL